MSRLGVLIDYVYKKKCSRDHPDKMISACAHIY